MHKFLFSLAVVLASFGFVDVLLRAHTEAAVLFLLSLVALFSACVARAVMTMKCDMCVTRVHRDAIKCHRCGHTVGRAIRPANLQH